MMAVLVPQLVSSHSHSSTLSTKLVFSWFWLLALPVLTWPDA